MTVADVLDRAAEIIETHGLCQGEWWENSNEIWAGQPSCVSGAIALAEGWTVARPSLALRISVHPAFLALASHLGYADQPHRVIAWNDDPIRTAERVVAALRECAEKLRAGEVL